MRKKGSGSKKAVQTAIEAVVIWILLTLLFAFAGTYFGDKLYWYLLAAAAISAVPAAAYYFFAQSSKKNQPPDAEPSAEIQQEEAHKKWYDET